MWWLAVLLKIFDFVSTFLTLYVGLSRLSASPELASTLLLAWLLRLPFVAYNIVREWRPPGDGGGGGSAATSYVRERWVVVERRVIIIITVSFAFDLVAGFTGLVSTSLLTAAVSFFIVATALTVAVSVLIASAGRQIPPQPI